MNLGEENEQLEHKESISERKEACDDIAAILNKHGRGVLYFGTKNNGDVIGQQIGMDTQRTISDTIASRIEPRIYPTIEAFKIEEDGSLSPTQFPIDKPAEKALGTFLGIVKVSFTGSEKPYSSDGRYYKRVADQDKKVTMVELRKMLYVGKYDAIGEAPSEKPELTFVSLSRELDRCSHHYQDADSLIDNLHLRNEEGQYNLMAELVSDQCPFSIKAVRFEGKDKTAFSNRNEFGFCSLIDATNRVIEYMRSLNETKTTIEGGRRKDVSLFDENAFREAWINAVVHSNWLERTPPAVYVFSDRIEVISHGGLPYDLSLSHFFSAKSEPVNPGLFNIFSKVGLAEETGHGVSAITSVYGREAFDITEKFVNVTMPFSFTPSFAASSSLPSGLSPIQRRVLEEIVKNPDVTMSAISEIAKISFNSVAKAVSVLKKKGYLHREGSYKTGKWVRTF